MATPAQTFANRMNAQASTGPTTPEGKSASSKNATHHGLTAAFNVLPHENREDFDELEAAYRSEFNPQTPHQEFMLGQMVQARWKLDRIQRLEALAFEQMLTEPGAVTDPDERILAALGRSGNILDKLQRYAAAANRSYNAAHRELKKYQAETAKNQAQSAQAFIDQYLNSPNPGPQKPNFQNEPNPAAAAHTPKAEYSNKR